MPGWRAALGVTVTVADVPLSTLLQDIATTPNNIQGLQMWLTDRFADYPDPQDWTTRQFDHGAALNAVQIAEVLINRRLITAENHEVARRWVIPPGSTIKPFTLLTLLQSKKLTPTDTFLCPQRLTIEGHSLNCAHPPTALPMNASRAIAYSCNCAVAHFAQRFAPGQLTSYLTQIGFASTTGILPGPESPGMVETAITPEACQLQALGETGIAITALELLRAYASIARRANNSELAPILGGLEGAVKFGTAQLLHSPPLQIAAKPGSVPVGQGLHAAWVAGFAPSRAPKVAFTVLVQGKAGGSDAAPIARQMLRSYSKDML